MGQGTAKEPTVHSAHVRAVTRILDLNNPSFVTRQSVLLVLAGKFSTFTVEKTST